MARLEKFTYSGQEFDITATTSDHGVEVRSSYNGKPIARYTATYETASDMQHSGFGSAVDHLLACAKADIEHHPRLQEFTKVA
jgi:hypothetical protein